MRMYVVDTFADGQFAGNPAAVVPVPAFPPVDVMQPIAHRIGLPTTAFVVASRLAEYRVRWFTPFEEVNLCGHATIASARHLFGQPRHAHHRRLRFVSDNGVLSAERVGDRIALDLPKAALAPRQPPAGLLAALGVRRAEACAVSRGDVLDRKSGV